MRTWHFGAGFAILVGSSLAGAAAYDWEGQGFFYSPVPRWTFDPEKDLDLGESVCPAIRKECPGINADQMDLSFAYDELYYANGRLAGIRLTKGSGCRPLDEAVVLGQREFRATFSKPGQPDLDDIQLEVGDTVDKAKVRIVRHVDNLQYSAGCP